MDVIFNNSINELDFTQHDFKINIYVKQRNTKKYWTIIENLTEIENSVLKDILKDFKKLLSCNGSINKDEHSFIQLQGDHRDAVKDYLIKTFSLREESIIVHGF